MKLHLEVMIPWTGAIGTIGQRVIYEEIEHQGRCSLNVWCGMLDGWIIGLFIFDNSINEECYIYFLRMNCLIWQFVGPWFSSTMGIQRIQRNKRILKWGLPWYSLFLDQLGHHTLLSQTASFGDRLKRCFLQLGTLHAITWSREYKMPFNEFRQQKLNLLFNLLLEELTLASQMLTIWNLGRL